MGRSLFFVSWNVNGIRAAYRKGALDWIGESGADIVALQEIKAKAGEIPEDIFARKFRYSFINPSHKKGQSGVALYSEIEPDYHSACHEVDILREGRINEIHFGKIAFFNVYFPNGQRNEERLNYKMEFYERFLKHIQMRAKEGRSIIFCGDLNTAHRPIDLARAKANEKISGFLPMEREWIDRVEDAGYIDTFRHIHPDEKDRYSWWSVRTGARKRNVGWRIDYFFVSRELEESIEDADILSDIEGSDHAPVTLRLRLPQ